MHADAPVLRGWRPPPVTTSRQVVGIVVAVIVLAFGLLGHGQWLLPAYAALVTTTAMAIRGAGGEPGTWLGRRAVRRGLVAAIATVCALLLALTSWPPAAASGVVLLILLVCLVVTRDGRVLEQP